VRFAYAPYLYLLKN
jgi:hypothetical protein